MEHGTWNLYFSISEVLFFAVIDANNTCDWTARASVYWHKTSVITTFIPAPVEFGFSEYNISLISDPLVLQRMTINTTDKVSLV